jgi:hypothetical protein
MVEDIVGVYLMIEEESRLESMKIEGKDPQ